MQTKGDRQILRRAVLHFGGYGGGSSVGEEARSSELTFSGSKS